jgi:ferric-dicitrate binding protein FerR (iron transport regulator)
MTAPACDSWKALLAGFLYEDLDAPSRDAAEAHLAGCAPCREALQAMREASESLDAWKVPARATRRKVAPRKPLPLVAAAAAALIATAIFFATRSPAPPDVADPVTRRPEPRLEEPKPVRPPPPPVEPIPAPGPAPIDPKPQTPVVPEPPKPAPPKPQPEPETTPAPPLPKKEPPSPTRPAPAVVAQLEWVHGQVQAGGVDKPKAGAKIHSGETVATTGPASLAVVRLADGTRIDLEGDTQIGFAEKIDLVKGAVTADVAKQPAGRAVIFTTPHAEARILGTRLRLSIDAEGTRLDVREGRVRFTRTRDGASTDVAGGTFSMTGAPRLAPRAIREVAFQDGVSPVPAYAGTRDTFLSQTNPNNLYGTKTSLQVDGDNPGGTGNDLHMLLRWDLSSIPKGSKIQSVVITLRSTQPAHHAFSVYALRRTWTEEEATWVRPWQEPGASGSRDRGAALLGSLVPLDSDVHVIRLNAEGVTLVQSWIDAPESNHGLVIPGGEITNGLQAHSRESQDVVRRPKLTVTYLPK